MADREEPWVLSHTLEMHLILIPKDESQLRDHRDLVASRETTIHDIQLVWPKTIEGLSCPY